VGGMLGAFKKDTLIDLEFGSKSLGLKGGPCMFFFHFVKGIMFINVYYIDWETMLLNIFEYHIINILNIVEIELNNIGVGHENFNPKTLL